jgi:Methane oxygenase PmoA
MGERVLTVLRLGDVPVGAYRDGSDLERTLSPRPYLHPVRTLAGTVVTDARPADHPWHLGISVALQDVDGWNFWGGPTYARGQGYVWRDDHGRIDHTAFERVDDDGFVERLGWVTSSGRLLLTERRGVHARLVEDGWQLELTTTMTNATDREVRLGSPATNGRAGAGYGGFFWRLPPVQEPAVRTPDGEGEGPVNCSRSAWLAWTDRTAGFTLVFARTGRAVPMDPWFVRVAEYPGVGVQLAARDPLALPPGHGVTRGLRVLLADGVLPQQRVRAWADATEGSTADATADATAGELDGGSRPAPGA